MVSPALESHSPAFRKLYRFQELKAFDDSKAGVKGLVDASIAKLPRIFVRPPEEVLAGDPIPTKIPSSQFRSSPQHTAYDVVAVCRGGSSLRHGIGEKLEEMLEAARAIEGRISRKIASALQSSSTIQGFEKN
uniref:Uncharacterized protein n=1 Tax=Fagus sylvatica TaxID=28930 RepID=A0A2N9IHW1_FAGSY